MDRDEPSDKTQLAAAADGDGEAFAAFYRRHLPLVIRWCLRETQNREVAADLSAEVFAAALTAAHRYRPEQGSAAAWLLGIARNKLRESRRRGRMARSARERLGMQQHEITDADLERVDELASLDEEVLALVDSLPADQRAALLSRVVSERSYEEIAAELRCSQATARQYVSRGLRTLRRQMEQ